MNDSRAGLMMICATAVLVALVLVGLSTVFERGGV